MGDPRGRTLSITSAGLDREREREKARKLAEEREKMDETDREREREREREAKRPFGLPIVWVALNASLALVFAAHICLRETPLGDRLAIYFSPGRSSIQSDAIKAAVKSPEPTVVDLVSTAETFGPDGRGSIYTASSGTIDGAAKLPKLQDSLESSGTLPTTSPHGENKQLSTQTSPFVTIIPGSKLKSKKAVTAFRSRWQCLTSLNTSHWKLDPRPRLLPWPDQPLKGCGSKSGFLGSESNAKVLSGEFTSSNWPVADSLKYVWEPKSPTICGPHHPPSFKVFNKTEFCATMRKRGGSLFIVGDSISSHFFIALKTQLLTRGAEVANHPPTASCAALMARLNKSNEQLPANQRLPCETLLACGPSVEEGGVFVHFVVSMFLRRLRLDDQQQIDLFPKIDDLPELAWGKEMVEQNASVVLLNRGAHFIRGKPFVDQLNHTLHEFRDLLPNALLVYRSTAAGHPNCSMYEKPIETPLKLAKWPFNWDHFGEQNEISRKLVESVGGVYLDVQPMASLRPDWHLGGVDCLHYCQPGPVNDWVKMFAKMLQDLT